MRTTCIMNLKGGTGKTVTAINMAAILARDYAMKVLLVDADSQANLTEFVSRSLPDGVSIGGFADLLTGLEAFAYPTKIENVRLLPADETLMGLDISAAGSGKADPMALRDWLGKSRDGWDWVIVDCPPAFNAAAAAALVAADDVVIPLKLDAFGVRGLANIVEQIRNMRRLNPDLEIAGVLPTMFYPCEQQRKVEDDLLAALTKIAVRKFHHINRSPKVDEMTFAQAPIIDTSPRSKPARDYRLFVKCMVHAAEGGEA